MFLPMSWTSPRTVASTILPTAPSPPERPMEANAILTVSAPAMRVGRKRLPASYLLPSSLEASRRLRAADALPPGPSASDAASLAAASGSPASTASSRVCSLPDPGGAVSSCRPPPRELETKRERASASPVRAPDATDRDIRPGSSGSRMAADSPDWIAPARNALFRSLLPGRPNEQLLRPMIVGSLYMSRISLMTSFVIRADPGEEASAITTGSIRMSDEPSPFRCAVSSMPSSSLSLPVALPGTPSGPIRRRMAAAPCLAASSSSRSSLSGIPGMEFTTGLPAYSAIPASRTPSSEESKRRGAWVMFSSALVARGTNSLSLAGSPVPMLKSSISAPAEVCSAAIAFSTGRAPLATESASFLRPVGLILSPTGRKGWPGPTGRKTNLEDATKPAAGERFLTGLPLTAAAIAAVHSGVEPQQLPITEAPISIAFSA